MKHGLVRFLVLIAAAIGLAATSAAQMGAPPPPPPTQTVETLCADYPTIVTGTITNFDPIGSLYSSRNVTVVVRQTFKGEPGPSLTFKLRQNTRTVEDWKLHDHVLLIALPKNSRQEAQCVDLSDPDLAVVTEALRLLRDPSQVTQAIQTAVIKKIPPGRFDLVLPSQLVKGTALDAPRRNVLNPIVTFPIDSALESDAHRLLGWNNVYARASAVDALENFKTDENIRLLRRLLTDNQYSVTGQPMFGGFEQHNFIVRQNARQVLVRWGLDPGPIEAQTAVDVATSQPELFIDKAPRPGLMDRLARSNRLETLYISSGILTDEDLKDIGRMTHLHELSLDASHITDRQLAYLAGLKELKTLNLNANDLTKASLPTLSKFKSLTSLYINRNGFSDEDLDALQTALPATRLPQRRGSGQPPAVSLLVQTTADCTKAVYTLQPRDTRLSQWSTVSLGQVTGPLQWNKSPSGRSYLGPFGQQAVTLHLKHLPAHHNVTVEIDLWVIGSWDGDGSLGAGPDIIDIHVAGVGTAMHSSFFNNDDGPGAKDLPLQSFPDVFPRGRRLAYTGASEIRTLGFTETWDGIQYHRDAVYKLRYTFSHDRSNLNLSITGENVTQPGITDITKDERWGIGGVRVKTD